MSSVPTYYTPGWSPPPILYGCQHCGRVAFEHVAEAPGRLRCPPPLRPWPGTVCACAAHAGMHLADAACRAGEEADYADLLQQVQARAQTRQEEHAATEASRMAQDERSPVETTPETPEANTGHPDAKTEVSAPEASDAWRGMLAGLLGDLRDATLAHEARSVLEDAEVSETTGSAMVSRVLDALDAQAEAEGSPF